MKAILLKWWFKGSIETLEYNLTWIGQVNNTVYKINGEEVKQ